MTGPVVSGPPPADPIVSGPPPAGTVTMKGAGWRVNLPQALLISVAGAVGARMWWVEQRAFDQAKTIDSLSEQLRACRGQKP